jgi:adenine-specific DNA methylase
MKLFKNASSAKLRGGYYTPAPIASFLLRWGINDKTDRDILEPSCGDGVFLEQIVQGNMAYNSIAAVEIDSV